MHDVYKNIKRLRLENGWTQLELANKTGYTNKSTITKIEQGKVDLSLEKVKQFAKVFGVDAGELMGWVNIEPDKAELHADMIADTEFIGYMEKVYQMSETDRQKVFSFIDFIHGN